MNKINPKLIFVGLLIGVIVISFLMKSIIIGVVLGGSILFIGWFIKSINDTNKKIKEGNKK